MVRRFDSRILLLSGAVTAHIAAAVLFSLEMPGSDVPSYWHWNAYFILALSAAISVAIGLLRSFRVRFVLLLWDFGLIVLIGIPEGRSLGIETILTLTILAECILGLKHDWRRYAVAAGMVIGMCLAQTAHIAFVGTIPNPTSADLVAFSVVLLLGFAASAAVSELWWKLQRERTTVQRLDLAVTRLTDANIGFQRYAKAVEGESVGKERKRISREIHDTIGYTITTLIMLMEAASDLAEGDRVQLKSLLKQGIDQAIQSLDEIRGSLRELRAMELPHTHGLRAIKRMIQAFEEATRVQIVVDFTNVVWDFDDDLSELFYRMIQESLANAFRHGGATRVDVTLSQSDGRVWVSIRDNGRGSTEVNEGIGISGMRERIGRLNGKIVVTGLADGFLLSAEVPLERNPETQNVG